MKKTVEQHFEIKFPNDTDKKVFVTARNYNDPYLTINGKQFYFTAKQLKILADSINEIVKTIAADPDFSNDENQL